MARVNYREEMNHHYKGFQIWGTGTSWNCEAECFEPDGETSKQFWAIRNEQPELKTMAQAKKWINQEGIKLIEKLKGDK